MLFRWMFPGLATVRSDNIGSVLLHALKSEHQTNNYISSACRTVSFQVALETNFSALGLALFLLIDLLTLCISYRQ
jgi:hypothetical protein